MTDERLYPFPDRLLQAGLKAAVIDFLNETNMTPWWKARQLKRWGAVVGVEITRADLIAVGRDWPLERG